MMETYVTDEMRDTFANHQLELVQEGFSTAYYMKKPDTRKGCVLVTGSPEGITITGGLTPECNGTVSKFNKGLLWFAETLPEEYLCTEFLTTRWVPKLAVTELRDPSSWIRDYTEDEDELNRLANHLENGDYDADKRYMVKELEGLGVDCSEPPGYGYDPKEAGWLCAIQQAFSRLYPIQQAFSTVCQKMTATTGGRDR